MIKNDFQLLVEELAAYKRMRDTQMAKAMRAPKITRLDGRDIQGIFRLAKAMREKAERDRLEQRRMQQVRAAEERRGRFQEMLAKASSVLHEDVISGKIGAFEAGKRQAQLHRLATLLPPQVIR